MVNVVKSAERVVQVLELFSVERKPLSAATIARQLSYPKSSTNVLLRSLVALGVLTLDAATVEYFPAPKVTNLGDWIPETLLAGGDFLHKLQDLHSRTGETCTLSMQNGYEMQFIEVMPGTFPISLTMRKGFRIPVFYTAAGTAFLSTLSDEALRTLWKKAERLRVDVSKRGDFNKLQQDVRQARTRGYVVGYERVYPDTGAISMPVLGRQEHRQLVVSVGGLLPRIRRSEAQIIEAMRRAFRR
jgi:DNA-binding IclR family transcriptional regulator